MQKNHAKRTALALFLLFAVTVSAQAAKVAEVIPIGHTVGIKMQAEGVLIVQLTEVQGADGTRSPAKEAGVQEGDVLRRAGETVLHSNDDLQKQVALSAGQPIKLTLERGDAEKTARNRGAEHGKRHFRHHDRRFTVQRAAVRAGRVGRRNQNR